MISTLFLIKFFANESSGGTGITIEDIYLLLPSTFAMHIIAMIISAVCAQLLLRNSNQTVTIAIEVGLQNTALALLITGTIYVNNDMSKPALVYAMFSFFSTFIFALFTKKIVT